GRIGARIELATIRAAVEVTVDADARAFARRHAGIGQLLAGRPSEAAQLGVAQQRIGHAVGLELAARQTEGTALLEDARARVLDHTLDREIALTGRGTLVQEVDARAGDRRVRAGEGHLLSDDRGEVRVERQDELLDLSSHGVRAAPRAESDIAHDRIAEAEERVDAAVVQEAEAAHLVRLAGEGTGRAVVAGVDSGDRWHAEHAHLLVRVAQMRDLEILGLVLEGRQAVGPEMSVRRIE